ncbi:hypothetical protein C8T65DRAFT_698758 [Cerioporus squamosus]|nr:hypothetical protein C8T65DRAFT_698758 [Cerioporus squamosus]
MRFLTSILTIAAGVLAIPLSLLMVPSIIFRIYLHYLPLEFDHPHVQASLTSLWDVNAAAVCLLPPFNALAFLCPASGDGPHEAARTSLHDLLLHRQVLLKKAVQYAPTAQAISSISLLAPPADAGMDLGDLLSLLDREAEGPTVVGDPRALMEIAQTSAIVARALYRLLIQVELGVCRAAFVQDTISVALSLLEHVDATGHYIQDVVPLPFDRAAALFGLAVLDSFEHIRGELRVALTLSTTLLAAIENVRAEKGHIFHRCAEPVKSCAEINALIRGENMLRAVIQDLSMLQGILDVELDGSSPVFGAADSPLFIFPAIQANGAVLDALLLYVQNARRTAAAAMETSKYASQVPTR